MKLVAINTSWPHFEVTGSIRLVGRIVYWNMSCLSPTDHWQINPTFGEDYRKNWELWLGDVMETFLQLRSHDEDIAAPYLELQLSPSNQPLGLVIIKPRESFYTPLRLSFHSQVHHTQIELGHLWSLEAQVSLPEELQGSQLWGGMFACLGSEEREFHAPHPWEAGPANFHQPQYFQRLT